MMHPEIQEAKYWEKCMDFPALYEEKKFVYTINLKEYLARQAGSALWLCRFYRKWLIEASFPASETNFYERLLLVGPLLHLVRLHERQAFDVKEKVEAIERRSWYLDQMYARMSITSGRQNMERLAVQAIMYLRGWKRYTQLVQAGYGHPWTIWIRDAELNARLCLDVLEDMAERRHAKELVCQAANMEAGVMEEIEARK